MHVQLWIFLAASLLIAAISHRSLIRPASHGFARFFLFEIILWLLIRNAGRWFDHPFSAHQITSWFLLLVSIYLVVSSIHALHHAGRTRHPGDQALFRFEETAELVQSGPYRYVRHPMYGSLLFLAAGAALKQPDLTSLALLVAAAATAMWVARREEKENERFFGSRYTDYMMRTRRFIPFFW